MQGVAEGQAPAFAQQSPLAVLTEGAPILIRPDGFEWVSGKFCIAKQRDGETTFKQYIYDGRREYLVPLNKDFRQVEMDDEWDVIGRIVDVKAPRSVP
ncbi:MULTISPECIES: S24 family peptidase [unclassified Pseudomonas]|uniref:S24 family peptidase n=1 Tax=Pseudomonas sp. GD03869 TaxID=2975394 RepID=UPI002449339D|nr:MULTISPECIES: S24 family peptidase [unclassified Pseudomonas]MDG9930958.1 S24 family peptidase [Pseudomonas sp. GD04042]MDH0484113.1 S24 family peptidase [Pseudomonas sp. GD04015]MDH0605690.1 S24 family peptidase [Pseudomonas sp. GD03869]